MRKSYESRLHRLEGTDQAPLLRVTFNGRCVGPNDCGHAPGTCDDYTGNGWLVRLDGKGGGYSGPMRDYVRPKK